MKIIILIVIFTSAFIVFNLFSSVPEQIYSDLETIDPATPEPTLPPPPISKTLSGGIQIFQTFNNCGPAALSMALSHYGINISQDTLGDELRPYQIAGGDNDDKSVTFSEIAKKAREYGFTTYHRPNGNVDLIKNFIEEDIPVITRTLTKDGEDIGHYRVVKGYDDARGVIMQDDSLRGKNLEYSYSQFNNLWKAFSFEYLVLVPQDKIETARLILGENLDEKTAWSNALESSEEKIAQEPNDIYAKYNKLVALFNLGEYEEAVRIYESVGNSLPPRMLWYQIEPIVSYQKVGQYDKVFNITDALIQNGNRAFSEVYQIRGEIYTAQGDVELANSEFEKVTKYNKYFY